MNTRSLLFAMFSALLILLMANNAYAQEEQQKRNYRIAQFELTVVNAEDERNLERSIDALAGVVEADIDREEDFLTVYFDKNIIRPDRIIDELETFGYKAKFLDAVDNEPLYYKEDEEQKKN